MALVGIQFRTIVAATEMRTCLGPSLRTRLEDDVYLETYFSIWEEQQGCGDLMLSQGFFFGRPWGSNLGFEGTQAYAMSDT